ncbi:MAG: acyl-CoA dehydrogenase [bacterium]|nr:MAG: acyl-CoA dehydrogenase [bacterium]
MDFKLTEQHEMIRDTVRKFTEREIKPVAAKMDREKELDPDLLKKMADEGLFGFIVPEEYGGAGLDKVGYCLAMEEIGRGDASVTVTLSAHQSLACVPIILDGSDEQKEKYLPLMAGGEKIGAFALTEPGAGSDAAALKTTAVRDGGNFIVNGTKLWCSNGGIAGVIIIFAVTDAEKGAHGGITAFIVESGFPGFKVGKIEDKMGIRASNTAELIFEDMKVPADNMLGIYGAGFITAMKTLDVGRLGLGAGCVGASKEMLEMSLRHASERVQFGKPIAEQGAVQFMLADMTMDVYAMESMVYRAASAADAGEKFSRESAIVKAFCSEAGDRVVDLAMQVHAGMGYMADYPVERFYRDSRINRIFEGTNEIQRLVIFRDLLKKGGY